MISLGSDHFPLDGISILTPDIPSVDLCRFSPGLYVGENTSVLWSVSVYYFVYESEIFEKEPTNSQTNTKYSYILTELSNGPWAKAGGWGGLSVNLPCSKLAFLELGKAREGRWTKKNSSKLLHI